MRIALSVSPPKPPKDAPPMPSRRRLLPLAIAAGFALLLAPAAFGQFGSVRVTINDAGHMFSRSAVDSARESLARSIKGDGSPRVVIETVDSLDGQTIGELAGRRHEQEPNAFYLALAKREHKISDIQVPRRLASRVVEADHHAVREAFLNEFKKNHFDDGLARGAEAIAAIVAKTADKGPDPAEGQPSAANAKPEGGSVSLVDRHRIGLTLAGARRALAAAEAKATEMGVKENLAVVDDGGHLLAFARLDGARPASISTAITKATAAATLRQPTGPIPANGPADEQLATGLALQAAASDSGGKITTLLGGVPLMVDGQVVGAIGAAGGNGEQDKAIASAGAEAFAADVKATPVDLPPLVPNDDRKAGPLELKDPPPALDPLKTPQER